MFDFCQHASKGRVFLDSPIDVLRSNRRLSCPDSCELTFFGLVPRLVFVSVPNVRIVGVSGV